MGSFNFDLDKRPKRNGTCSIRIRYYINPHRKYFKTGLYVKPDDWNHKKEIFKNSHPSAEEDGQVLQSLKADINRWIKQANRDGRLLSFPEFERRFNQRQFLDHKNLTEGGDLVTALYWGEKWIEDIGSQVSKGTLSTKLTFLAHLKKYSLKRKKALYPREMALPDFYYDFSNYLTNEVKVGDVMGLTPSSRSKQIGNLKTFVSYLKDNDEIDRNVSIDFMRTTRNNTYEIALRPSELETLEDLSFRTDDSSIREVIRDMFLVMCETGLRISDAKRLTKNHVTHDGLIEITAQKTQSKLIIPISPRLKRILAKRNGDFPRYANDQVFNKELKKIGEMACIDEPTRVVKQNGNIEREMFVPRFTKMTAHTGRRSFATIHYDRNPAQVETIMRITGHKNRKQFFEYIRRTEGEERDKVKGFFG